MMNNSYFKIEFFIFFNKVRIMLNKFKCIHLINKRIKKEICKNTIIQLNDQSLLNSYLKTTSVQCKINNINNILSKLDISKHSKNYIIQELLPEIIPPGTKGVIKGNKFNQIVKHKLLNFKLDSNRFEIKFETKIKVLQKIDEIPDWYIYDKKNNKYLIGMNQVDLWGGGHQLNRGFKYLNYNTQITHNNIVNNSNLEHKIICVICNEIVLKNTNNKIYYLFSQGFDNNSICYLNNLENIIYKYFK